MPDYPTPSEYQEAVQVPETAFADPELQDATPRTNVLGLPQPVTGAFAAVFPMTTDAGRTYAAKCFLNARPRQEARYEAISEHLDDETLDVLVDFDHQPSGIRVGGTKYPLLKMEWAEGTVLSRFVEDHLDAPDRLNQLAAAWADLMDTLEAASLAHGDLQHGNVLVDATDEGLQLRLVDYDTMYVPVLDGWSSAEVGHRNYQHPDRTEADFGPHLDRFAGLVVYTALRACAHRPDLWAEYDTGENLLFRDDDFYDPEQSPLFDDLAGLDPVDELSSALRAACYLEPTDVPSLEDVRAGRAEPSAASLARARRPQRRPAAERFRFARAFLPVLLAAFGAAGGLAAVGAVLWGAVVMAVGGAGAVGWAAVRYRTQSLVRRRRRLEQEDARFTETIRSLKREREEVKRRRADLLDSLDERRAERLDELQEEALRDRLKHHFIGEVRTVDGLVHKHVVRLKSANIRTAYEATPEAVANVRRISDEARARINMWRAALVQRYEDEVPDRLSPAEERRLERYIEHRVEDLDDQLARTREKIQVQTTERERVRERLDEMPALTPLRYAQYLLRLRPLPTYRSEATDENKKPVRRTPDPVPAPPGDEKTWWKRNAGRREPDAA